MARVNLGGIILYLSVIALVYATLRILSGGRFATHKNVVDVHCRIGHNCNTVIFFGVFAIC